MIDETGAILDLRQQVGEVAVERGVREMLAADLVERQAGGFDPLHQLVDRREMRRGEVPVQRARSRSAPRQPARWRVIGRGHSVRHRQSSLASVVYREALRQAQPPVFCRAGEDIFLCGWPINSTR